MRSVPVAAWRWAAGFGLVPPADAGRGLWSQAVVEAADPEAVRAILRGPVGAGVAADRLTEALGVPLPILRPLTAGTGSRVGGQCLVTSRSGRGLCISPRSLILWAWAASRSCGVTHRRSPL